MKNLIIIPTYNESQNIEKLINKIFRLINEIDILIVDDNSPDKTYEIVQKLSENNKRINLIKRAGKLGLGSAYIEGFKFALDRGYDYILQMDADFSHNPKMIPGMLKECQTNDLVIGSRYIVGINVVNWPMSRLLLSFFASFYVQIITGMGVKDPTSGFKCFKNNTIKAIDLEKIKSEGYSFQIEMNYRVYEKGLKIKEIPIVFTDRIEGTSKMTSAIIIEAIFMVWKLRFANKKKR